MTLFHQCIAAMVMLQLTAKNSTFYDRDNINILPSFQVRVEWLHVSVVILYTAGLVCTTSTYIHWVRKAYLISTILDD